MKSQWQCAYERWWHRSHSRSPDFKGSSWVAGKGSRQELWLRIRRELVRCASVYLCPRSANTLYFSAVINYLTKRRQSVYLTSDIKHLTVFFQRNNLWCQLEFRDTQLTSKHRLGDTLVKVNFSVHGDMGMLCRACATSDPWHSRPSAPKDITCLGWLTFAPEDSSSRMTSK